MYFDLPIRHGKKFVSLHFFNALQDFRHQPLKQFFVGKFTQCHKNYINNA